MSLKKLVILAALWAFSSNTWALNGFYGGGFLGLTDPSEDGADMEISFGARGGVLYRDNISFGIYLQRYATNTRFSDLTLMPVLAELRYSPSDFQDGVYFGGLMGITQQQREVIDGTSRNDSYTTIGISGGYSIQLTESLSWGPELSFTMISADPDNYSILNMLAFLNYKFE